MTERGKQTVFGTDPTGRKIVYAHGKSIFIVDLQDPSKNESYGEHSYQCTVAKYSPSGYYVASADVAGNVRIWDATQATHALKAEYRVLSGPIRDLEWNAESKHIVVVGEGRESFAHAFHFDTGSGIGEVIGHTKTVNSVSFRPCKPARIATASDDFTVNFYTGTPYKFSKSLREHSRFVQCVRYAPDGSKFATCGLDGKIFIYSGESADLLAELKDGEGAHGSGILALAWSPDSTQLASSAMDQSTKVWDVAAGSVTRTIQANFTACAQGNHVVGSLWTGFGLVLLGLTGSYAIVDAASGKTSSCFSGHQKGLSALFADNGQIYSASYDGQICEWDAGLRATSLTLDKESRPVNQVDDMIAIGDGRIVACAALESKIYVLKSDIRAHEACAASRLARLDSARFVAISGSELVLFKDERRIAAVALAAPSAVAAHGCTVAVGLEDKSIAIFKVVDDKFEPVKSDFSANLGAVGALAFSADGSLLAAGDDQRRIKVYKTDSWEPLKTNWCFHSAKITCLAWVSQDLLVSGSLDNGIMAWAPVSPIKPLWAVANAHSGPIIGVAVLDAERFVTASQDGSLRIWRL